MAVEEQASYKSPVNVIIGNLAAADILIISFTCVMQVRYDVMTLCVFGVAASVEEDAINGVDNKLLNNFL
jgi:hypothetical protein